MPLAGRAGPHPGAQWAAPRCQRAVARLRGCHRRGTRTLSREAGGGSRRRRSDWPEQPPRGPGPAGGAVRSPSACPAPRSPTKFGSGCGGEPCARAAARVGKRAAALGAGGPIGPSSHPEGPAEPAG
eukprot:CAMPEP_0180031394 /NCGR_PEP_ID=MMETSP0984-20121128/27893_1 /TAXON_ID=483367 /ORGANISM="non described non described, Strain CCMP 2436" /LENGTH=126 /DNA_ID=CAMNT_0021956545 /DNA_START=381 /DNA_END=758 /DNA_ORIENTATION=-